MAIKVDPIILSKDTGRKWWHIPDSLWRRNQAIRERRLSITLRRHIFPLLQKIEAVQLEKNPSAKLYLKGKTFDQVIADPVALELAMYIYEMALGEGLIRHSPSNREKAISIRYDLDGAVGSCGITPNDVARRYVSILAGPILQSGGHGANDIGVFLSSFLQTRVQSINRLRLLAKINKITINEMRQALPSIDQLLQKDEKWLIVLSGIDGAMFLRPLRQVLKNDFPEILKWSDTHLVAAAKGLNRPEKIIALGESILEIKDPAMFDAFGSWPTSDDGNGNLVCRITQIKETLGGSLFSKIAKGSPALVRDIGSWPQKKLDLYKPYLGVLTGPAMKLLEGVDEGQGIAMIDGLVEKFDMPVIASAFKKKEGLLMLQGMINELKTMNRNSKQAPDKIKKLVLGTYFDDYMGNILSFS